ncbi:hypothetical protein MKW92_022750, partial [Papaver armeniacum]
QVGGKGGSYLKSDGFPASTSVKLQLERKRDRTSKITNLKILPKLVGGQGGENITGNLEAHVDGFQYTTSRPDFCVDIWYDTLKSAFYQVGDDRTPPLLHFMLHDYIVVGSEKTKHIQFHWVLPPMVQKKSTSDLKKIEKDELLIYSDVNEDLEDFVEKVQSKWRIGIVFEEVEKMHKFHGVFPSKASGDFALTFSSLVGLVEEPFIVEGLREVELVYLAQVSPNESDMTLVFEDYSRQVLQINSIPLKSVAHIKAYLNLRGVKYYENNKKQNWVSIMERIKRFPQDFINKGGWEILNPNGYEADMLESLSEKNDDEYE